MDQPVVEELTHADIVARWHDLFDRHPGLEGVRADPDARCQDLWCCTPDSLTPDLRGPLSTAGGLLLLAGIRPEAGACLSRDLMPAAR